MPHNGRIEITDKDLLDQLNSGSVDADKLSKSIGETESGNKYDSTNPNSSATGKYQFLWNDFGGSIKKVTGVKSQKEFLNNPDAQEKFFQYHVENNLKPAVEKLSDFNDDGYTQEQLAALAHFKGEEGAKEWLTAHQDKTSKNNKSIEEYVGKPGGNLPHTDTQPQEVNDPSLLTQLNEVEPTDPQKKSPDISGAGLPVSSTVGQNGLAAANVPVINYSAGANDPISVAPATQARPDAAPSPALLPHEQPSPSDSLSPLDVQKRLDQSSITLTNALHEDVQSDPGHPYLHNILDSGNTGTANVLQDVGNPHGDPEFTGGNSQYITGKLQQQKAAALQQAYQSDASTPQVNQISADYDNKINGIKQSAQDVTALQLFNKEYAQKGYTEKQAEIKTDEIKKQKQSEIDEATKAAQDKVAHIASLDPSREGWAKSQYDLELTAKLGEINEKYANETSQVKSQTKWDNTRLGMEQAKVLGDKQAAQDAAAYDAGQPINPASAYKYNIQGVDIMKFGWKAAAANGQTPVVDAAAPHIDSPEKIEANNKPFVKKVRTQMIGDKYSENMNPFTKALLPHLVGPTQSDVKSVGKQIGFSPSQVAEISPDDVPRPASIYGMFAKGAIEGFPGWKGTGVGAAIAGNTPSGQNTFSNPSGAVAQMFQGMGGLTSLGLTVATGTELAEGAGMLPAAAEGLSNFGVMSTMGFNDAWDKSKDIIGDKPEDFDKRVLYSSVMGLVNGALFSIHPQYQPLKNALGIEEKSGEQILKEIQSKGSIEEVLADKPSFTKAVTSELATQVGLMQAQKIAEHIVNTIANPKIKEDLPAALKQSAAETALTMFIPVLMGASGRVQSQGPLNNGAMFEIGTHPDKYIAHVSGQLAKGKITPDQAQQSHAAILEMKGIIDQTPTVNNEGKPLTPDQVKAYANNLLQRNILQRKLDGITKQGEALGGQVDEAQAEPVKKQIADLKKERTDIFNKAGASRIIQPIPAPKEEPEAAPAESPAAVIKDIHDHLLNNQNWEDWTDTEKKEALDFVKSNPEDHLSSVIEDVKDNLKPREGYGQFQEDIDAQKQKLQTYTAFQDRLKAAKEAEADGSVATKAERSEKDGEQEEKSVSSTPQITENETSSENAPEKSDASQEGNGKENDGEKEVIEPEVKEVKKPEEGKEPATEQAIPVLKNNHKHVLSLIEKAGVRSIAGSETIGENTKEAQLSVIPELIKKLAGDGFMGGDEDRIRDNINNGNKKEILGFINGYYDLAKKKSETAEPVLTGKQKRIAKAKEAAKKFDAEAKAKEADATNEPLAGLDAARTGEASGQPESKVDAEVKANAIEEPAKPLDEGIKGPSKDKAESFEQFRGRVGNIWNYIKKTTKNGDAVVTHSSTINLIHAAEKHGWDNPELAKNWAEEEETQGKQPVKPGELIPYKIDKDRTIYLARHGESQDGQMGKMRREDTPLTEDGREEAKRIAESLKEKGIEQPHIFHSTLPRAVETADIIREHLNQKNEEEEDANNSSKPQPEDGSHVDNAVVNPVPGSDGDVQGIKAKPGNAPAGESPIDVIGKKLKEADTPVTKANEKEYYVKDGVTYIRNKPQEGPTGNKGKIEFSRDIDKPFTYQLVESENLQPASTDGNRNPSHFIPDAQPKPRADAASKEAAQRIAGNPDLGKVGEAPNAYTGAPVVNARGEVIQGNNRAEGLVKHYVGQGESYKKQLAENAGKFGFTKEQVEGMKNPILVRRVDVGDQEAVKLGNYDAKDIETGGKNRIDPVATSRRIPASEKRQILDAIIDDKGDKTANASIRDNYDRAIKLLKKHLRPAQLDALTTKSGEPTPDGLRDVEKLITHFLFDGGDANLPEYFGNLPSNVQKGITKAFPKIFSVSEEHSLVPEIQNAMAAHEDFRVTGGGDFDVWKKQKDLFKGGLSPQEILTPLELKILETLKNSKTTQNELRDKFADFAHKVNGASADMFSPKEPGISKEQAVKETFNTPYNEKQSEYEHRQAAEVKRVLEQADKTAEAKSKTTAVQRGARKLAAHIREQRDNPTSAADFTDEKGVVHKAVTSGISLPKELRDALYTKIADFVEATGNLHAGIHKAIQDFMATHGKDKGIDEASQRELEDEFSWKDKPMESAPPLNRHEQSNYDTYQSAIDEGLSYKDAVDEVMETAQEVGWTDKHLGNVLNALKWQNKDKAYFNEEALRTPEYEGKRLDNFQLSNSAELSNYLSGKTMQEKGLSETDPFEAERKLAKTKETMERDAAEMVGLAKLDSGEAEPTVFDYGTDMLGQISKWTAQADAPKRIVALRGLHREIAMERDRLIGQMGEAQSAGDKAKISQIISGKNKLDKLQQAVERETRTTASLASETMNALRIGDVVRGDDMVREQVNKILTKEQATAQEDMRNASSRPFTDTENKQERDTHTQGDVNESEISAKAAKEANDKKLARDEEKMKTRAERDKWHRKRDALNDNKKEAQKAFMDAHPGMSEKEAIDKFNKERKKPC